MSVESEVHFGRPSTSQNKEVIEKVCCLTLRKILEEVGISRGSVHSILTKDLCMQSVSQIHSQAAEGARCGNRPRHARLCKQ